jgi:hypothetical protein
MELTLGCESVLSVAELMEQAILIVSANRKDIIIIIIIIIILFSFTKVPALKCKCH